ncbi:DUF6713 family protein [Trichocoleus sp. FACHB-46]|uniref:DUF6713 family protein n=1 Tax=Trichocoleus TaxID=450526 RepID=UPI00351B3ADF
MEESWRLISIPALFLFCQRVLKHALVVGGLFAAFFHSYHLWRGDQTFTLPISISLLIATLVLSVLQAGILLNMGKKGDSKNT